MINQILKYLFISHFDFTIWRFKIPLLKRLIHEGHQVFVTCPPGDVSDKFSTVGIQYIPLRLIRDNKNPLFEIQTIIHIRQIINELSPDLIHTFTVRPNLYGSWANRLLRQSIPIVNSVMGLGTLYTDYNGNTKSIKHEVMNRLYKWSFAKSKKVIFLNHDDLNIFLEDKIIRNSQADLIRGEGINIQFFHPVDFQAKIELKKILNIHENKILILLVARLIREKGILEFCQAARILKEKYKDNVHFVVIGDIDRGNPSHLSWDDLNEFRQSSIVQFTGHLDEPQPFFAASDIYCLPSYREGLPVTIMEAMSSGLPVITTDSPGCRETIDNGVSGFLVPVRDVNALINKLEQLILNPDLRIQMGRAGRVKAEREFAVEKIVEQHMKLYEEVLNSKKV